MRMEQLLKLIAFSREKVKKLLIMDNLFHSVGELLNFFIHHGTLIKNFSRVPLFFLLWTKRRSIGSQWKLSYQRILFWWFAISGPLVLLPTKGWTQKKLCRAFRSTTNFDFWLPFRGPRKPRSSGWWSERTPVHYLLFPQKNLFPKFSTKLGLLYFLF